MKELKSNEQNTYFQTNHRVHNDRRTIDTIDEKSNKKDKFKYVYRSESVFGELVSNFGDLFLVKGFSDSVGRLDSLLVPFFGSFSSLAFQLLDEVFFSPSDLA